MAYKGSGYLGSDVLETSVANAEIIPDPPSDWTYGYKLYKMDFMNQTACTIRINDKVDLYLLAKQGFKMNIQDEPITSFKIIESGIQYNWIGAY